MKSLSSLFLIFISCFIASAQSVNFNWAKKIGGLDGDYGTSITVDNQGNIYTLGVFQGTADFDPGSGTYSITSAGDYDIFISKLNAAGNFLWAKSIGSTSNDKGYSIAVDEVGGIYINGTFGGAVDFDLSSGVFNLTAVGQQDIFILKLDSSANFKWVTQQENSSLYAGYSGTSLVLDPFGNLFSTGVFQGTTDFDPSAGVTSFTTTGVQDVYITKLDTSGNFIWAKQLIGNYTSSNSIFCDRLGNVYTSGAFIDTTDFDPGPGTYNLVSNGSTDDFILKLDGAGNFVWAKSFGDYDFETGNFVSVDSYGNVYATGGFKGTIDFDPNSGITNLTSLGATDVFISKLDINGNLMWTKNIGEVSDQYSTAIHTDSLGNIYVLGNFYGYLDFNPNTGVNNLGTHGILDIFILKLDANGNFIWVNDIGGISQDMGFAITVDKLNNVYTTGYFQATADFDSGVGTFTMTSADTWGDIFIHKMSQLQVGIKENTKTNSINLYPNPNNGKMNYSISNQSINKIDIEIYNELGILVFKTTSDKKVDSIDINHLANGFYYVKVLSNNDIISTEKIIKE